MASNRRSQDANAPKPAMKVVGFRVEGVPQSPDPVSTLKASTEGGGSPDPVIIPPALKESDRGFPTSPRRTSTLPSFVPEGADKPRMRALDSVYSPILPPDFPTVKSAPLSTLWEASPSLPHRHSDIPAQNPRDVVSNASYKGSSSDSDQSRQGGYRLLSSSSLPPMGEEAAELQAYASEFGGRAVHSSRSATNTPAVSPYRNPADRPISSSYRQSGFDLGARLRPELGPHPATFTDGTRFMERARPIQPHMSAAHSDAAAKPAAAAQSSAAATPRFQHGFQVSDKQDGSKDASLSSTPFAASASTPHPPELPTVAEGVQESASSRASEEAPTATSSKPPSQGEAANQEHEADSKAGPSDSGKQKKDKSAAQSRPSQGAGQDGKEEKKKPTKAERRALQERQRADKAAAKEAQEAAKKGQQPGGNRAATPQQSNNNRPATASQPRGDGAPPASSRAAQPSSAQAGAPGKQASKTKASKPFSRGQTLEMFAHLPQYRRLAIDNVFQDCSTASKVHPVILQLGLQYANGAIAGGNARCLAMLLAFKVLIQDYQTPESKELARDLTSQLNLCIQFLVECRPLSISMGTAIKNLKLKISQVGAGMQQQAAKAMLLEEIDTFIQEKITYADEQVARIAQSKLEDGDVVLTFAFSSAVLNTFLAAKEGGKQFRVVVVDSRPHYEGRSMLAKLLAHNIPCSYLHLNALCYTMQEVTKVFIGASGAMSNGTILARAGSASVAMVADAMQRPVIICCETLKFVDRVQLDSITYNELGDPDVLASVDGREDMNALQGWAEQPQLELLNLVYDAMPCKFVTLIITEVGAIPPTSVPVVLREYRTEPRL